MHDDPRGATPPTFEELISALAPGTSEVLRQRLMGRLRACDPEDEFMAGAKAFLEDNGEDFDMLREFLSAEGHYDNSRSIQRRSRLRRLSMAGIAAALLVAVTIWRLQAPGRHEWMASSIFHESGPPVFAGRVDDKSFNEMVSAYRLNDPTLGLALLRNLEKAGNRDMGTLQYFGGWFQYMRRDYDSAALFFGHVEDAASPYRQKAELMRAASLCLGGRYDSARGILNHIISDSGHPYRKEASTMLADDRLW
jgi:hypothetical protein